MCSEICFLKLHYKIKAIEQYVQKYYVYWITLEIQNNCVGGTCQYSIDIKIKYCKL